MRFDLSGHEFDLRVQRFLVNRWETPTGTCVQNNIIEGLKTSVEIRAILDGYILKHPDNSESYGYPIYPSDCITSDRFWVINPDDLRGIHFYNEDFTGSPSFEVKLMDYAHFHNCNFDDANMARCSFTRAHFNNCSFQRTVLADAVGFYTVFRDCDMTGVCLWMSTFIEAEFRGCDLRDAYLEDAEILSAVVDYKTEFGQTIMQTWRTRSLPLSQLPDIYRMMRTAYAAAELNQRADEFLYRERQAFRKYVVKAALRTHPKGRLWEYMRDTLWEWTMGYGTRPFRILPIGPILAIVFGVIFAIANVPFAGHPQPSALVEYMYFSITSFATLGLGDLAFGAAHPWLRLISAGEALVGAAWIAVFVAVLSRKLLR